MYKLINDHAAPNLGSRFKFNFETECPYNLRNSDTDLVLSRPNKDFYKWRLITVPLFLWNKLPYKVFQESNLARMS